MTQLPFVSVIIPVRNDPDGISRTLQSLFSQSYPLSRYEVIVVDNDSDDHTVQAISEIIGIFDGCAIVEIAPAKGSYAARNTGIRKARGDIFAFIDADMTVGPDWIAKGVACMMEKQADYVGCRVAVVPSGHKPLLAEKYDMALGFPVRQYMAVDGYAPTACLFVRRWVMGKVGDFDPRLFSGGDCEFGTRVRDHGFHMVYDPINVMVHPARQSFSALIRKQRRVTLGQIRLRRLFPDRFGCNRFAQVVMCCAQLFPVASPGVLKKLKQFPEDFFSLFAVFYVMRCYGVWLKLINRCFF